MIKRKFKWWLLLVAPVFWGAVAGVVVWVEPSIIVVFLFHFLLLGSLVSTLALFFGFHRRVWLLSLCITSLLLMRALGYGHVVNIALIVALFAALEMFLNETVQ